MANIKEVLVPDTGGDEVQVIEIGFAIGDDLAAEDGIITVETDKATMDIPAPFAGKLVELNVAVGDTVSEGTLIAKLEVQEEDNATVEPEQKAATETEPVAEPSVKATADSEPQPQPQAPLSSSQVIDVVVPDIGDATDVEIIDVLVSEGEEIDAETGLITLETDKASMDVPAPQAGTVKTIKVKVGDKISAGGLILQLEIAGETAPQAEVIEDKVQPEPPAPMVGAKPMSRPPVPHHPSVGAVKSTSAVFASPSVRRLAREFGVDLNLVTGSGRKNRILKEDVQAYVKYELSRPKATAATVVGAGSGLQVIDAPNVDFSKFGEVEEVPLTRIQKISGPNLHRNWVTIPHVTQFDEADITELEAFRKQQNAILAKQKQDVKITPLVFMMKAVAKTLQQFPMFNSSLDPSGEKLIHKKYYHIGVAVDTPNGLVVPVVRDVDKKGIIELSRELAEISVKAREGKLKSNEMQGSCFTISSLGGIGGTAFTPIVNYPDVAILGVSKSEMKPKWNGSEFEPKLMLPLSLSYDHRVIDGAQAARFSVTLSSILSDMRMIIL